MPRYIAATLALAAFALAAAAPARAEDINSFRRAHHLPPLAMNSTLAALAYEQAHSMASRNHLDHNNYKQRLGFSGGFHAENVAWGCDTEDCAYRLWARSPGHRANMLLRNVSAYGLASATAANGRKYWALELGN
jgi:uncharacterized protein YkwD